MIYALFNNKFMESRKNILDVDVGIGLNPIPAGLWNDVMCRDMAIMDLD